MKKLWKIKKDSEAVSPVIATILMVAITVVLAAVLLVLVLNIGDESVPTSATLVWDADNEAIQVSFITQGTPRADLEFRNATATLPVPGAWSGTGNIVSGSQFVLEDYDSTEYPASQVMNLVYKPTGAIIGTITVPAAPTP